jgi:arylsulfatase
MLTELDAGAWELYHVAEDVAETRDLAADERQRLIAMIAMWYAEAGRYNVLPLDGRGIQRIAEERPQITADRSRYVLYPNTQAVPAAAAPRLLNRPYTITADVELPEAGAEGVLLSMGGIDGGISFYVQDDRLCFAHNYVSLEYLYAKSEGPLPRGRHFLSMEFEPTGDADRAHGRGTPGVVRLFVDGRDVGRAEFPVTTPYRMGQGAAMQVGLDGGGAVTPEYRAPFRFTGTIRRVVVDVSGEHVVDYEAEMRIALARQ